MNTNIINIIALGAVCLGVIGIFFERDIFKENRRYKVMTKTSGFVVSCIALVIVYIVNR